MFFTSCETSVKSTKSTTEKDVAMVQETDYKISANKSNTRMLHYKLEESISNPIPRITYYVTDQLSKKVVTEKAVVAAEKIYWKNNTTLAIIPYKGMIKKEEIPDVNINANNEILIPIK